MDGKEHSPLFYYFKINYGSNPKTGSENENESTCEVIVIHFRANDPKANKESYVLPR